MDLERDDAVDAMRYTVNLPVDPAALAAMVATTGVDMGLEAGLKAVRAVALFGVLAVLLGSRSPTAGWFVVLVLLIGLFFAQVWLMWRRYVLTKVAASLIDRFGKARYKAAQPIIDTANRIISES
jgi:hypothetical protein